MLTTPVIRCLHSQLDTEIHFLTKRTYLPLLEANPYLSKVLTIDRQVSEIAKKLIRERYDAVVDLHKNLRSIQVAALLRANYYTFDKLNLNKWLLVNFKLNIMPGIHIVDRYLKAVAGLGVVNDGGGLDYFIPPGTALPSFVPSDGAYLALAMGAAHETKKLPADMVISICRQISYPIVLLGGKEEMADGEKIVRSAGNHVHNACGKLTLNESALVLRSALRIITHDTGMMHIAAAFQKEILSVWGNTVPAFGMTPYYGTHENKCRIFEVQGLSCRPCSKIGFEKCPQGHFRCMRDQPLAEIIRLANR